MTHIALLLMLTLICAPPAAAADDRPVIVVNAFETAPGVAWPYEAKTMQNQAVTYLKAKLSKTFEVVAEPPADFSGKIFTLSGQVTGWRAGNAAKRVLVGMGSGREAADIHYWLADGSGRKIFDSKDTIRAEFFGNAMAGSVGQLAHPFATKIAKRIADAKLK